ncbi:MAG: tripartite tricarboxylate transporter substrate binding protein [Burkholderiales bacterium]
MSAATRFMRLAVAALAMAIAAPCWPQAWPAQKPIRIVSAFPAGGTTDILARVIAQKLTESLGQSVIVENRTGAGGVIGTEYVAKSAPDGYTFLLGNSGALASGLTLFPNLNYDPSRDFASVAIVGDVTIALAVNPDVPAKTFQEFLALAKERPGKVTIALASLGSLHHLLIEQMKKEAGIDLVNVPYKGSAPAVTDLVAGTVMADLDNLPAMISFVKAGRARALVVADAQRSSVLPDVPTFAEVGMPSLTASPWFALVAPAGTPRPVIERMNREVVAMMRAPEMREKLAAQGLNARWSTPEEADQLIKTEMVRWARVAKESGAKLE